MNVVLKLESSLIMLQSLGGINPKAEEVQAEVPPMLLSAFGGRLTPPLSPLAYRRSGRAADALSDMVRGWGLSSYA